jgi:hypothetical protein
VRQVVEITQAREYHMTELHPAINPRLSNIQENIGRLVETPIAGLGVPLEGRETLLRTNETSLGNFLCDLLKIYFNTDIAFTLVPRTNGKLVNGSDGPWVSTS